MTVFSIAMLQEVSVRRFLHGSELCAHKDLGFSLPNE
jgi:hypothetical protein